MSVTPTRPAGGWKPNVYPQHGARPIADIEAPEFVRMIRKIEKARGWDLAKRNAAGDIKPGDVLKSTRKVHFARVNAKELPALLRAIEVYDRLRLASRSLRCS